MATIPTGGQFWGKTAEHTDALGAATTTTDLWHLFRYDIDVVSWSNVLLALRVQGVVPMMFTPLLLFLLFLFLVFLQFLFVSSLLFQFHVLVRHGHSCGGSAVRRHGHRSLQQHDRSDPVLGSGREGSDVRASTPPTQRPGSLLPHSSSPSQGRAPSCSPTLVHVNWITKSI